MPAETRLFVCLNDNYGVLLHDPDTGATATIVITSYSIHYTKLYETAQPTFNGSSAAVTCPEKPTAPLPSPTRNAVMSATIASWS